MEVLNRIKKEIMECKPVADTISNYLISAFNISPESASEIWDALIQEKCDIEKKESLLKYVGRICYRLVFNMKFDEATILICKSLQRLNLMFKAYSMQENIGAGLYHISSRLIYGCLLLDNISLAVSLMERYVKVIRESSKTDELFQYVYKKDFNKLTSLLETGEFVDNYNNHISLSKIPEENIYMWCEALSRSEDNAVSNFTYEYLKNRLQAKELEAKNKIFDFTKADIELAKLTAEAAVELDPNVTILSSPNINWDMSSLVSAFIDRELSKEDENIRIEVKKQILNDMKLQKEAEEQEKKKKELLKDKIKLNLENDAEACYRRAYELCGNLDTYEAYRIRYEVFSHVKGISDETKIKICENYLDYLSNEEKEEKTDFRRSEKAEVLEKIGRLKSKQLAERKQKGENIEQLEYLKVLSQYENALRECDSIHAYDLHHIMRFCKEHCLEEKYLFWSNAFVKFFDDNEEKYGHWGSDVFSILVKQKRFDDAEKFLHKWEEQEHLLEDVGEHSQLFVINSYKNELPFLRNGINLGISPVVIDFFDYIHGSSKMKLVRYKNKYREAIEKHRYNLMFINSYKWGNKELQNEIFNEYLEACVRDIEIIPIILESIDELVNLAETKDSGVEYPRLYKDKYTTAGCDLFVSLERYYTNNKMYQEAIEVCNKAIACGFLNDGTKSGMIGRRERVQKKITC